MCCLLSKSENSVHFGSFHAGMIPLVIPRFFNAFQESPRLLVEPTLLPLFQMLQSPVLNQGRWSPGEKEKRARGGVRGVVCTLSSQGFLSYLRKDSGALGGVGVEREGIFVPRSLCIHHCHHSVNPSHSFSASTPPART